MFQPPAWWPQKNTTTIYVQYFKPRFLNLNVKPQTYQPQTFQPDLCPKLLSLENPFEFIWNLKSSFEIWKLNLMPKTSMPWKSISILDLKSSFDIWKYNLNLKKKNIPSENYFKHGPCRMVQCVCVQPYHVVNLNTTTWHHSRGPIISGAKGPHRFQFLF